ncbi:hypothetical protein AB0J86_03530 [Micromonospora sp. NPDC049559]|uniref:hypothetical protein n=1 Tax=Micromonospora sp. NPDC049559 TaxID=3155923 RepID=UPI0034322983
MGVVNVGVVAATVLAVIAGAASPVRAHHGWGAYRTEQPLYLAGRVTDVTWRDPHLEVEVDVPAGATRPADLAQRRLPELLAGVGGAETVPRATVPDDHAGRWRLELAPAGTQESRFGLRRESVRAGDDWGVVGYRSRTGDRELRPELIILPGGESVSQRSVRLPGGDGRAEPARTEPGESVAEPDTPSGTGLARVTLVGAGVLAAIAVLVVLVRRRAGRSD